MRPMDAPRSFPRSPSPEEFPMRVWFPLVGGLALCMASVAALAHPLTVADLEARFQELNGAAMSAYDAGDYGASADHFRQLLEEVDLTFIPGSETGVYYNYACSAALAGRGDEALDALSEAVAGGWSNLDHLRRDTDLDAIRDRPEFEALVKRMVSARETEARIWDGAAFDIPYAEDLPEDLKIAGLSRLWMEAKINFAFFDQVPGLDWDQAYLDAMPRVRATTSTKDYYRVLQETVALLEDGHTNVYHPRELREEVWSRPPIRTALIEGRVIVTEIRNDELRGVSVGDELLTVNGQPVKAYAAEHVAPIVCASTPQDRDNRLYGHMLLQGAKDEPVTATLETAAGERREVILPRDLPAINTRSHVEARMLDDGVGYLAIHTFSGQVPVDSLVAEAWTIVGEADGLVIDIRDNGGGSSGWWVMRYLTSEYELNDWATREYLPSYRAWGRAQKWHRQVLGTRSGNDDPFEGKVALLVSRRTFSAAEDLASVFHWSKRGETVGEATGGSTGQPLFFTLPGGGSGRICTKRDTYPDGSEWVGYGIPATVEVPQTVAAIRAGRDEVLERAVALVR